MLRCMFGRRSRNRPDNPFMTVKMILLRKHYHLLLTPPLCLWNQHPPYPLVCLLYNACLSLYIHNRLTRVNEKLPVYHTRTHGRTHTHTAGWIQCTRMCVFLSGCLVGESKHTAGDGTFQWREMGNCMSLRWHADTSCYQWDRIMQIMLYWIEKAERTSKLIQRNFVNIVNFCHNVLAIMTGMKNDVWQSSRHLFV